MIPHPLATTTTQTVMDGERFNEICARVCSAKGSWISKAVNIVKEVKNSNCKIPYGLHLQSNKYTFCAEQFNAIIEQLGNTCSETLTYLNFLCRLHYPSKKVVEGFYQLYEKNKQELKSPIYFGEIPRIIDTLVLMEENPIRIIEVFEITDEEIVFNILKKGAKKNSDKIQSYKGLQNFNENQRKELFDCIIAENRYIALTIALDPSDPFKISHLFNTDYFFKHILKLASGLMAYDQLMQFNLSDNKAYEVIKVLAVTNSESILTVIINSTNFTNEQINELLIILFNSSPCSLAEVAYKFPTLSEDFKFEIVKKAVSCGSLIQSIATSVEPLAFDKKFEIYKIYVRKNAKDFLQHLDKLNLNNEKIEELLFFSAEINALTTAEAMNPEFLSLQSRAHLLARCIVLDFMSAKHAKKFIGYPDEAPAFLEHLPAEQRPFVEFVLTGERKDFKVFISALSTGNYTDEQLAIILNGKHKHEFLIAKASFAKYFRLINNSEETNYLIARFVINHYLPNIISRLTISNIGNIKKLFSLCEERQSSESFVELTRIFDKQTVAEGIDKYEWKNLKTPIMENIKKELLHLGSSFSNYQTKTIHFEGTIVEKFFFDPDLRAFAFDLIHFGEGLITKRMARSMILDCRNGVNPEYRELLLASRMATPADLVKIEVSDGTSLENRIIDSIRYLEAASSLYNLNTHRADFNRIFSIKLLKKEAKFLKNLVPSNEGEAAFKAIYEDLCFRYDAFVNKHLFFNELKLISNEIRALASLPIVIPKTPSLRLLRFLSLWGDDSQKRDMALRNVEKLFQASRKDYWLYMVKKAVEAGARVEVEEPLKKKMKWLHATTSNALAGLLKTMALIPAGMLMAEGIVPLTGEVCGSHLDFNRNHLSGEILTSHWHDSPILYFNCGTRFLVNLEYGTSKGGYCSHGLHFDPEEALRWAELQVDDPDLKYDVVATICIQILRIRMTLADAEARLLPLKTRIDKSLSLSRENKIKLNEAFSSKIAYTYTPEELKTALNPKPYPIIFASQTAKPSGFSNLGRDIQEYVVEGKQLFGKDIQIAFTSAENVDALSKLLNPFGIHVYDLEMAFYLETKSMITGSQNIEMAKNLLDDQTRISLIMQRDILPLYASLFPERPSYINRYGDVIEITSPHFGKQGLNYHSYKEAVEQGEMLPRTVHGAMHATRVAIWSQMLLNMLESFNSPGIGTDKINDRFALAIAAATHDLERQEEGIDHWDIPSSEFLENYITSGTLNFSESKKWVFALANKDPEKDQFTSNIQWIVHDADCLEIMRVLKSPTDFMRDRLAIMQLKGLTADQINEINLVIDEVSKFITMTESRDIKHKLEEGSSEYYLDVMLLITPEEFTTLHKFLAAEITEAAMAKARKHSAPQMCDESSTATPMEEEESSDFTDAASAACPMEAD